MRAVHLFFHCEAGGLSAGFKAREKSAWGLLVCQRASAKARWNTMAVGRRDRHPKNTLHCHGVATVAPIVEETTGAIPLTIIVMGGMDIVFAPERRLKASKLNAFGLFCIAFGFGNLVNHA